MKKIILLFILLSSVIVQAQTQFPIDEESGLVNYTAVVDLPGISQEELHEKAKFWIVSTLKSGDNMVELDGSNSDKIVGTGNLVLKELNDGGGGNGLNFLKAYLNFKFIVRIKAGKVKYSIQNFSLTYGHSNYTHQSKLIDMEQHMPIPKSNYVLHNKARTNFKERNTIYLDAVITSVAKNFVAAMKKQDDDDW